MTASPTLYFVRHGETDWNVVGRLQGQRDIPLNAIGRGQAHRAGERLRDLLPGPGDVDYIASPLSRTRETMERLRVALGLDPLGYTLDGRLQELRFGGWEGLTWKEVRARHPDCAAARDRDKWAFVPPDGESYAMLADRVTPVAAGIVRDTVLVSHGGVARALLARLCGVSVRRAPGIEIWQGRVLVIEGCRFRWT